MFRKTGLNQAVLRDESNRSETPDCPSGHSRYPAIAAILQSDYQTNPQLLIAFRSSATFSSILSLVLASRLSLISGSKKVKGLRLKVKGWEGTSRSGFVWFRDKDVPKNRFEPGCASGRIKQA